MTARHKKRVIDLNPYQMRDETLAAIKEEVTMHTTADFDTDDISIIDTFVLDHNEDGGLDSHATIFTEHSPDGGDN